VALHILAVGKIGRGPEAELFSRYAERLRPAPSVIELPEGRGTAAEIKRREAAALLAALPGGVFAIALDSGGEVLTSEAFAARIARWRENRVVAFLIGGAEGLDGTVLARANAVVSLSAMTWPHLLARAMLVEQLYRAQSIATGHPYHRAGRPA